MTDLEMKVEALLQCVPQDALEKALAEVGKCKTVESKFNLENTIYQILRELGIPAHLLGYQYLVYSITLCIKDKSLIHAITTDLYPSIAKNFNTTSIRVERAIRNAITIAWNRGDIDTKYAYFGNTINLNTYRPTNAEFIAQIVIAVRQKMKGEK